MSNKWTEVSTGGGCMALAYEPGDGMLILATYMGDEIPRKEKPADIGFYDEDGQLVAIYTVPKYDPSVLDVIEAAFCVARKK